MGPAAQAALPFQPALSTVSVSMWIAHHTEHNNSPHLWLEPIAAADCGQVPASLVTAFAWAVLLPQDFAFKRVSPAC